MKIIGITGGTGAGKSTVCAELKKRGAKIVDSDRIARGITQKGRAALDEIREAFGSDVIMPSGELDRKKLGKIVFSDSEKLGLLNEITHKHIFAEMKKQIDEANADIVVLDVPLLFQCDFPFECDLTVAILADREERIARIMRRDGLDRAAVEARMSKQLSDKEYEEIADVCFVNDGNAEKLEEFVNRLCEI